MMWSHIYNQHFFSCWAWPAAPWPWHFHFSSQATFFGFRFSVFLSWRIDVPYSFAGASACVYSPLQMSHLLRPLHVHRQLRRSHTYVLWERSTPMMRPYQMERRLASGSNRRIPHTTGRLELDPRALLITGKHRYPRILHTTGKPKHVLSPYLRLSMAQTTVQLVRFLVSYQSQGAIYTARARICKGRLRFRAPYSQRRRQLYITPSRIHRPGQRHLYLRPVSLL
jgi:hypothetical protein